MNASITVVWSLFKSCALKLSRIEAHWPAFSLNNSTTKIQIAGNRDTPGSLQIAELELSLKWKARLLFNGNNGNYPDCVMSKDLIALHSKSRTVYSYNTGSASLSHLTRKPRTAAQEKAGRAKKRVRRGIMRGNESLPPRPSRFLHYSFPPSDLLFPFFARLPQRTPVHYFFWPSRPPTILMCPYRKYQLSAEPSRRRLCFPSLAFLFCFNQSTIMRPHVKRRYAM